MKTYGLFLHTSILLNIICLKLKQFCKAYGANEDKVKKVKVKNEIDEIYLNLKDPKRTAQATTERIM